MTLRGENQERGKTENSENASQILCFIMANGNNYTNQYSMGLGLYMSSVHISYVHETGLKHLRQEDHKLTCVQTYICICSTLMKKK